MSASGYKLCKREHPLVPENVGSHGRCRTCDRERHRARYHTDPAYRQRQIERALERYYSDDPKVRFSTLRARVQADLKRRRQRIKKRQEERAGRDAAFQLDLAETSGDSRSRHGTAHLVPNWYPTPPKRAH